MNIDKDKLHIELVRLNLRGANIPVAEVMEAIGKSREVLTYPTSLFRYQQEMMRNAQSNISAHGAFPIHQGWG